jgi:hypothetical protein
MTHRTAAILIGLTLTVTATVAVAATSWVSVKGVSGGRAVCLQSGSGQFEYLALGAGDEAVCTVDGPRRVKIVSRYLFADQDDKRVAYDVTVSLDGERVLSKSSTGRPHADYAPCGGEDRVGGLRRAYVDVPAGRHRLAVRAAAAGSGDVAVRVFREVRRKRERWVAFAPASYDEIRTLQFESGAQSRYYHFDAGVPLVIDVAGPTTLRVATRLDFDHTMNGSQNYTLDVAIDDESWRQFHFDAGELTSAVYLERADILPGVRREARIDVPRGRHRVTVRCVRPEACGIAAMVHIPKSDLER